MIPLSNSFLRTVRMSSCNTACYAVTFFLLGRVQQLFTTVHSGCNGGLKTRKNCKKKFAKNCAVKFTKKTKKKGKMGFALNFPNRKAPRLDEKTSLKKWFSRKKKKQNKNFFPLQEFRKRKKADKKFSLTKEKKTKMKSVQIKRRNQTKR